MNLFIILLLIIFAYFSRRNIIHSLAVFLFLLPTYLIRLEFFGLPTTLLEVLFVGLLLGFIILNFSSRSDIYLKIQQLFEQNKLFIIGLLLFLTGATISLFISSNSLSALGEWKAFYLEPIIFGFILYLSVKDREDLNTIITGLVMGAIITSLLAIYQRFTGFIVPYAFWENANTYRVTAWYGFPNAVSLYLAPIIPFTIYIMYELTKKKIISLLLALLLLLAIIFSKSTGAIIAIITTLVFLLIINTATRRKVIISIVISLTILLSVPQMEQVRQEIFFGDRSGQIRLAIWSETRDFLRDNPIFGAGLSSYGEKIIPYHRTVNGEGIEIFHHPHNIFLTMWVNLGLIGLLGFIIIILSTFRICLSNRETLAKIFLASLLILIIHGLVDSPYIKNDLSLLFWFIIITPYTLRPLQTK